MLAPAFRNHSFEIPVLKTIAHRKEGIKELVAAIRLQLEAGSHQERKNWLLAEKAFYLIRERKMKDVSKEKILEEISKETNFNLYRFVASKS